MLRRQRQVAESHGQAHPEAFQQQKKTISSSKTPWKDASDTQLSRHLRAELRSIGEERLAALADQVVVEQSEQDASTQIPRLEKLRELARLYQRSLGEDSSQEQRGQYEALQEQVERIAVSRSDVDSAGDLIASLQVKADYFEGAGPELDVSRAYQATPHATERAIGEMKVYKNYIQAIQKNMASRFDHLSQKTRDLCESNLPIATETFACDVASFTQKKILGSAGQSLLSHDGLAPKVALSLIKV
jgi:hypothetical protein